MPRRCSRQLLFDSSIQLSSCMRHNPSRRLICLKTWHLGLATGLAAAGVAPSSRAQATEVKGQGASFPSKIYAVWARRFSESNGIQVLYKATGSGDGVTQISGRKVDFGGSDS